MARQELIKAAFTNIGMGGGLTKLDLEVFTPLADGDVNIDSVRSELTFISHEEQYVGIRINQKGRKEAL